MQDFDVMPFFYTVFFKLLIRYIRVNCVNVLGKIIMINSSALWFVNAYMFFYSLILATFIKKTNKQTDKTGPGEV